MPPEEKQLLTAVPTPDTASQKHNERIEILAYHSWVLITVLGVIGCYRPKKQAFQFGLLFILSARQVSLLIKHNYQPTLAQIELSDIYFLLGLSAIYFNAEAYSLNLFEHVVSVLLGITVTAALKLHLNNNQNDLNSLRPALYFFSVFLVLVGYLVLTEEPLSSLNADRGVEQRICPTLNKLPFL